MKKRAYFLAGLFLLFALPLFAQEQILPQSSSEQSAAQNKISLDLKGMDIADVLKMLATRSGMNIVIGKNVTGKVTIFLKDTDIRDAFEIVILSNDLAYEKKGQILNVMTQRDYELLFGERFQDKKQAKIIQLKYAKAADISRGLNQLRTNIGKIVTNEATNTLVLVDTAEALKKMEEFIKHADLPLETKVFGLEYAPVDKLSAKIQEVVTKDVGFVKVDERTNKIAVRDFPDKLEEIAKIIRAFDEKTPQVLIDAQIIEVDPSDKFEMGINWDYWIKKYFEFRSALPINTASTLFLGTVQASTPDSVGSYKAVMDIIRTLGDTKILSSPRIMVLNNQEAKIHVGKKEAYITSTTSQSGTGTSVVSQTVNFVDTGIALNVTPTINRQGFITMKIKPEISEATSVDLLSEGQKTSVPIVTSSDAETTVLVKDGVTVIMGGLSKEKRAKTVRKIPILGDIPLAGLFFRQTSDDVTNINIVILLTPHIVSGETSFSEFSQVPPKDGVVAKMVDGEIIKERIIRKPEQLRQEYYNLIVDKIRELILFSKPQDLRGVVEVSFTLDAHGQLRSTPQIISSSNPVLNDMVVACIKGASPFSPFPVELIKEEETFRLLLDYK